MTWKSLLASITESANALRADRPPADEWADAAQMIRNAEIVLAEVRHDIEKEVSEAWDILADEGATPKSIEGEHFDLEPKANYLWTYNADRIFYDLMENLAKDEVHRFLVANNALKMTWKITGLRGAFLKAGVDLMETKRRAVTDDLDEAFHAGRKIVGWRADRVARDES